MLADGRWAGKNEQGQVTAKFALPIGPFGALSGQIALNLLDTDFNAVAGEFNEAALLANYYVDSGTSSAMIIASPVGQTFTVGTGVWMDVLMGATNSGATTVTINGNTYPVVSFDNFPLVGGELLGTGVCRFVYDGTSFRFVASMPSLINIGFNAANFTASGAMTWTVASAGQLSLQLTSVGHMRLLSFNISGTIGGTPDTTLFIALPSGMLTSGGSNSRAFVLVDNNGVYSTGFAAFFAGVNQMQIKLIPPSTVWSAGPNSVAGQIWFQSN